MLGLFVEMKEKEDCFHFIACLCSVLLIGCFTEITRGPDSISSDKTIEQTENTGPDSRLYTSAVAALLLVKSMTYIAHCPAMTRCSVKDTLTEHGSKEKYVCVHTEIGTCVANVGTAAAVVCLMSPPANWRRAFTYLRSQRICRSQCGY